jgi:hypothetical protein
MTGVLFFFGEELLHNKQYVAQSIIMMEKPLPLPLVMLPLNCIIQPLQNVHVEMTSITQSRWYKLMVHQTVDVKEFRVLFDFLLYN